MRHSTSIGIDAHAKTNSVRALVHDTGEVREARLSSDPAELVAWIRAQRLPEPLRCVYEAGPTGFVLARALEEAGILCDVAATSKLPKRSDRVKNDRVDAEWLARMLESGAVRAVRVPSEREESLRHLSHLRGQLASRLREAKQRTSSLLLLTGTRYTLTRKMWTKAFRKWAKGSPMAQAADNFALEALVGEVEHLESALAGVQAELERLVAADAALAAAAARLRCLPGVGPVTSVALVAEVGDLSRFRDGAAFASFLGLCPSERSSGQKVSRGGVAKTGSSHLRRLVVEAACAYEREGRGETGPAGDAAPEPARACAARAARRLRRRYLDLRAAGKPACKARCAVARELACWMYHVASAA